MKNIIILVIIDKVAQDIKNHPNSTKKKYLGNPYKKWSSFMFYCPLIDLIDIDILILMAHGDKDMMSAVESSRIVRKEFNKLDKMNLTYIEYKDKDH